MLDFLRALLAENEFMRIFVIDEHPLMREAVGALIRRLNHSAVVIDIASVAAVAAAIKEHQAPELICMELPYKGAEGIAAIRELRRQFPAIPIAVLATASAADVEEPVMQAGATIFLSKTASSAEITSALRVFVAVDPEGDVSAPVQKLSKRQKQLLALLDKGMSNRDIAESLQISEHTVKVHLWRLFRRLNVKSRSQASHLARTQGLL